MTQTFLRPMGLCVAALALLAGCMEPQVSRGSGGPIGPLATPVVVDPQAGGCFERATTPAVIETVTEQIMVQPATVRSDGTVEQPAIFRTVTRQRILRERREIEFETPCSAVRTPEFLASVQRALIARGYYSGPITGTFDARTARAVERYQIDREDVHTQQITMRTARSLGLVALPRDQL